MLTKGETEREEGWDTPNPGGLLTVGFHQLHLHGVGDQRLGQFGEETLHGTGHGVDGEILLCQVQAVICAERISGLRNPQNGFSPRSGSGVTADPNLPSEENPKAPKRIKHPEKNPAGRGERRCWAARPFSGL